MNTMKYGVNLSFWGPDDNMVSQRLRANLHVNESEVKKDGAQWLRSMAVIDESPTAPVSSLVQLKQKFSGFNWVLFLGERGVTNPYGPNWTLQNWHDYVSKAVNGNPDVHVWDVWNEVAGRDRWTGYLKASGVQGYFEMLKDAYQTIKSHNSNDVVLCFGGLPTFVPSDMDIDLYNHGRWTDSPEHHIVQNIWSFGASNFCDGISVHPYSEHSYLLDEFPISAQQGRIRSNLPMRQIWLNIIQNYHNLCRKPVYFTETGYPSNDSLQRQSQYLTQSFQLLSNLPFSQMILWWNLAGVSQNNLDFGLYDSEGNPKPALASFSSATV
jgi:hypothetical protein